MNTHPFLRYVLVTNIAAALLISTRSMAEWTASTLVNTPTSSTVNDRQYPASISDGAGGVIIVWEEHTGGPTGIDIVAQRIDASGTLRWGNMGVTVCSAMGDQRVPTLASDDSGGAIITWYDGRGVDTDIYAQRVDANGFVRWSTDGVVLCSAQGPQWDPVITRDGSGGAIVSWYEARFDTAADIYAQRVNGIGIAQWTTNGVPICTEVNGQVAPIITTDESGGAVIVWMDFRNGVVELFAQRIANAGVTLWAANGVLVCVGSGFQYAPAMIPDGTGGAVITWHDFRSGAGSDIFAQRIVGVGMRQWPAGGAVVSNAASYQYRPQLTTDGASGAIICWYDYRGGVVADIYALRLSPDGNPLWTTNGLLISGAVNDQLFPSIVRDGRGGAFIGWQDMRNGSNPDIFAQHVNALGAFGFSAGGIAVSTATNGQFFPRLTANASGGAILAWEDRRTGLRQDVFVHRIVLNNPDAAFGYWVGGLTKDIMGLPAYAGLHASALDGIDGRDILEPSLPSNYISVTSFPTMTDPYSQDVRQETERLSRVAKRYTLKARTSETNSFVGLVFTEDRFPQRFTPVLYDNVTGTYQDARSNPVLTYTSPSTAGEARDLLLLLGDSTKPSVSIVTPNGGEVLVVGYPYTIQWNASDSSGLLRHYLYYTLDSLQPYMLIDSTIGQNTSYMWSPQQASMNAFFRIVTVDSVLNMNADTSDAPFTITAGDSVAYTTYPGWNMVAVPTLQTDMSPQGIFGDDLSPPIFVFGFNPTTGYTAPDTLRLGVGYWLRTLASSVIDAVGTVQPSVSRPLFLGWNMIGNPFPAPFPKSMLKFTDGVMIKSITEAESAGWLQGLLYGFNGSLYVQENVALAVWNGYWIRTLVPNITILYDLGSVRSFGAKSK